MGEFLIDKQEMWAYKGKRVDGEINPIIERACLRIQ
jgi:hypothetical protein